MQENMKNLVYIVAIDFDVKEYAIKSWESWCKKNNADFKVIDKRSSIDMAPHWERYTVFETFPGYDNYLYVDADALVRWDAPNFFDILKTPPDEGNSIYAVKDIGSLEWTYNSMLGYQDLFPDVSFDWWSYFTTGFLKFDFTHKLLFSKFIDFHNENQVELNKRQYKTLRKGFDQTPFNYFVRQQNYDFKLLPEVYSLGHLLKKDIYHNGMFLNLGYVWQFNGIPQEERKKVMAQIWSHVEKYYD